MRRFARWHVWLGWLVGLPIVMWLATGLFMVAKPIEEVRGNHLRVADTRQQTLPPGNPAPIAFQLENAPSIQSFETRMQRGKPVTFVRYGNGSVQRFDAVTGNPIAPMSEQHVRDLLAEAIVGGERVRSLDLFEADEVPFDFRRPIPVWRAVLEDETNVYVGRDSGKIEAVRTRWWRVFDFMWGLHIMDLQDREDTSHPILILFAALGLFSAVLGTMLMFRRRRSKKRLLLAEKGSA